MDDFLQVYDKYGENMHAESIPLEGAIEAIRELKKNHTITFMTARPEQYRKVTEDWFARYQVPFDQLIMTEGKLEAFQKINGDILIDDSPVYAKQFTEHRKSMILVDYPYNQQLESQWVTRARSWDEIVEILLKHNSILVK